MKVVLIISYDGTNYNGFQKQKHSIAIQNVIDTALSSLYGEEIETIGASRTDAKVHAFHQVVMFEAKRQLPLERLHKILNHRLPSDIRAVKAYKAPLDFHPRYSARYKTYEYNIFQGEHLNPLYRNFTLHVEHPLNLEKMNEACNYLLGTHNFKGFSNVSNIKNTIRTIYYCSFQKEGDYITFIVKGNGFLYNMVRILVATLIDIGRGKKEPSIITEILLSQDRKKASPTQKPYPLILKEISYEDFVSSI